MFTRTRDGSTDESEGSDQPSDLLRERAAESQTKLWLLLEADRRLVTGTLLGTVFVVLTLTGYLYPTAEASIRASDSVDTLFQAMLGATITGVTLVLTLNQFVLSQELGAVGDQRERMAGAMKFREDAADVIQAHVSPPRPAQFLRALVEVSAERTVPPRRGERDGQRGPRSRGRRPHRESPGEREIRLGEPRRRAVRRVRRPLGRAQLQLLLEDILRTPDSRAVQRRPERGGRARPGTPHRGAQTVHLAREHFETLYFQWELINLSRTILTASIPALLVSPGMVAFFNDATYSVTVGSVETLMMVVSAATTIALLPFFILLAYGLRIATVTKHTLSMGPFILRETDQVEEVEWNR